MAERVLQLTATIPAGTAIATPYTATTEIDNWEIEAITLAVPPGPSGLVGFYLANNGQPWIPRTPGEWLIWDDHVETFTPTGYPNASGWEITGYNLGQYDHAVTARFHVNAIDLAADQPQDLPYLTFIERDVPARDVVTL
jgi:hypothetical protein